MSVFSKTGGLAVLGAFCVAVAFGKFVPGLPIQYENWRYLSVLSAIVGFIFVVFAGSLSSYYHESILMALTEGLLGAGALGFSALSGCFLLVSIYGEGIANELVIAAYVAAILTVLIFAVNVFSLVLREYGPYYVDNPFDWAKERIEALGDWIADRVDEVILWIYRRENKKSEDGKTQRSG